MLIKQLTLGTVIIVFTVIIHVICLLILAKLLKFLDKRSARVLHPMIANMNLLVFTMLGIILAHTSQIWLWAFVYLQLGEFQDLVTALYFSVTTMTTLGFGDITLSESWRLLSTFEAMGGLIVFGASTAFIIGAMRHLFEYE